MQGRLLLCIPYFHLFLTIHYGPPRDRISSCNLIKTPCKCCNYPQAALVKTREMEVVEGVLLSVKFLVSLKHLLMVCKVAVLQTLLGHLRTLLQASTTSETGDPKEIHFGLQKLPVFSGMGLFSPSINE